MRFQSMYVDMRPVVVKWLGILLILAFITLFVASVRPDLIAGAAKARAAYQQGSQGGHVNFSYWEYCLRSGACISSSVVTWSAPSVIKAFVLGGLIFGVMAAVFGMLWRPEIVAMRDTRVNALNVEESRLKSPVAPRGLL